MKINYTKYGDYYLPDLKLTEKNNKQLNKYGLLRLNYLKEHKKALYQQLLMTDKLNEHLFSVGNEAKQKIDMLMKEYIKNDSRLSEKSKKVNPLEWTRLMNNYKNTGKEIILKEYIYGEQL